MKTLHTRKTDEELLIQFALDHGWDEPELMNAVNRIKNCHKEQLQDYAVFDETDVE